MKEEELHDIFNLTLWIDEGEGHSKNTADEDYLEKSSNKKSTKIGVSKTESINYQNCNWRNKNKFLGM